LKTGAGPRKRPGFFKFHYNGVVPVNTVTKLLAVLCLALAAGTAVSGLAQASNREHDRYHDRGGDRAMGDRAISLDEAVARAERRYDARVVRAEERRHGDRIENRIRLLGADGRVFEVRIDAESGRED
jgi:uncharacterized membrane protein YkoI